MRSLWYGILGILVLIAIYMVGLYGVHTKPKTQMPDTSVSVIATSTIATSTDIYSIDLAYPKFALAQADAAVQSVIDKAVSDFTSMPPNPTPVAAKNELDGAYQVINPGPEILSVRQEIYQYTGGAHGGTTVYGFNFHKDGTPVTLDEALSLTGQDLQGISAEAQKQLNDDFGMVQFPEGATPDANNYSTFVIGTSTVTFIFQQYQVEAYAAGMPEVVIPRIK